MAQLSKFTKEVRFKETVTLDQIIKAGLDKAHYTQWAKPRIKLSLESWGGGTNAEFGPTVSICGWHIPEVFLESADIPKRHPLTDFFRNKGDEAR